MANEKNLKRGGISAEQAPIMGSKGGKASVKAKREKKLMSQIYGEFLAERFKVRVDGKDQEITGADLVGRVVKTVLNEGGSPAVSLMKEIREATEGSRFKVEGELGTPVKFIFVDPPKKHADPE
jgi:hypothetical protein